MKRSIFQMGLLVLFSWASSFSQSVERLTLQDAVTAALKNNPEVLRAQREIDGAEGRILQAGRIPNPEIAINFSEVPTSFNIGQVDQRELGISQQIEFPTKRGRRIDIATFDKVIAELQVERTKTLVTVQVKKAYYGVLFSQEIVKSLEGQLNLLRDFQQLVQSRFEAAASNYLDVVRSKVEIARTTNDLTDARRETQLRATQLNLLLGRSSDGDLQLTDSLAYVPLIMNKDTLVAQLQKGSVALKIVQRTVARQQSVLGLAETSYLPDFSVGVSHQRIAEQPPFNANDFGGVTINSLGIQL
ncbi:MAG: TolC family protein, partial [bacterium]